MNVLIIGLGSIAIKHVNVLRKIMSDVKLFALRSSYCSRKFDGITNIYEFNKLSEFDFDFVIISNPTALHIEALEIAMDLKLPIFIEKPLFANLQNADILENVKKLGIINYVACNIRFLESIIYLRDYVQNNVKIINEINVYCGSFLPEWRPGTDYKLSYSSNENLGGGVHLDLIHEIDYLYWIFGMPKSVISVKRCKSSLEIKATDYANYILEYDHFCASVILNYYRRDIKRTCEVIYTDETLNVDLIENKVTSSKFGILFQSNETINDTYFKQMEYFLKLIGNKELGLCSLNSISDAYNVLKIILS